MSAQPDEIIHQSLRLKIMAALHAEPRGEALEFSRLKAIVQATDGNLGSHLTTLEKAGYVAIAKGFVEAMGSFVVISSAAAARPEPPPLAPWAPG